MGVPGQVFGDSNPRITGTVNRLQYFAMKGILGQDRLSGSASVPFRYFGNGGGPAELGKSACEIWKLGKDEMCLILKSTQIMSLVISKLNYLSY